MTNEKEWIENRIIPIISECIKINLIEERYNEVLEFAEYVDAYLKLLGRIGAHKAGYAFGRRYRQVLRREGRYHGSSGEDSRLCIRAFP